MAKILIDGTETTIFSETIDRAMLLSIFESNDYEENNIWFSGLCDLNNIDLPITWVGEEEASYEECYYIDKSWPILITIEENEVPLPPTLLLFGSGLEGLAFYRRRKLICRS